jgi:hypothetical protein
VAQTLHTGGGYMPPLIEARAPHAGFGFLWAAPVRSASTIISKVGHGSCNQNGKFRPLGLLRNSVTHKRSEYEAEDFKILPKGYINTALIEEQWEDILRFVATIKLKVTTASQLFRRLNSYAKLHPLYRALKEFGKIVKSIFILRYADQLEMRQVIQKILNKGEHANRFSKAVGFGNNQAFAQGEKSEQEIAETCRRLIKNSIICWNYLYASKRLLEETDKERQQELLTAIRGGSMVAWRHINLHGEYDFSDENLRDSVGLDVPKIQRLELN